MAKKVAPWIIFTAEEPGLDAQSRGAINEWCGVVGKEGKYRRQREKATKVLSRVVDWNNQQRSHGDPLKVERLPNDLEDEVIPRVRPSLDRRIKTGNNIDAAVRGPIKTLRNSELESLCNQPATLTLWKDGSMGIRVDPFDCVPGTTDDPRQGEILDYCEFLCGKCKI